MKKSTRNVWSLLFVSLALLLTGCANTNERSPSSNQVEPGDEAILNTGTLYLMVNPEIALDYDEAGLITNVRGMNSDGEAVIEDYADYIGKESEVVLEELILRIGKAGYFVEEIEGESKQIVIELEAGSALPGDNFLQEMATSAQRAVEAYQTNKTQASTAAEPTETPDSSTPPDSQNPPTTVTYEGNTLISMEQAKQAAFAHAGLQAEQLVMDDQELDTDDGIPVYELEFHMGPDEYDYHIHGLTGEVLSFEQDIESSEPAAQTDSSLSLDQAKQIAFNHAGVDGAQARFDEAEWDEDDGVPYYSLEFVIGEAEYDYEIHAVTGDIIDFDHDWD